MQEGILSLSVNALPPGGELELLLVVQQQEFLGPRTTRNKYHTYIYPYA